MKKLLLVVILGIFLISLVSSAQTQTNINSNQGYQVYYPDFKYVPQNMNFTLHLHLSNLSNGLWINNSQANCRLHLYNSSGKHTFESGALAKDSNWYDWEVSITSGNFSDLGTHSFYIWCYGADFGGEAKGIFEVTKNGQEATTGKAVFYIGLLFVLLFFLGVSIYFFTETDNLLGRVGSLGIGYLLIIAITFIAWNMSADFFVRVTFVTAMFRILFYVFLVGLFPLIIGSFAWYLIMVTRTKEIQRLMDKGIGYDEANRRAGKGGKYK